MALKSKDITQFFPADLSQIRSGVPITFELYLYFEQNRHLLLWRKPGDVLFDELKVYSKRGLARIWIHRDDKDAFTQYLAEGGAAPPPEEDVSAEALAQELAAEAAEPAAPEAEAETEAPIPPPAEPETAPQTGEGAFIAAVMESPSLDEATKKAVVAEAAKEVLAEAAAAEDVRDQTEKNKKLREVVQDVLASTSSEANALVAEIWKIADFDPDLEHAVNVATYSVVFSMAFGKIEPTLVSDLAMAGLLHDVGVCKVDSRVTSKTWNTHLQDEKRAYSAHVKAGVELLSRYVTSTPPRVPSIISQSHEKFDGSGYPGGLKGFGLDDVAQLLALAEFVDSIASGQWDGTRRTMKEALAVIEGFERKRTFPEYFNPEVFSEIMRWTRSVPDSEGMREAAKTVGSKARDIVGEKA